ncbi:MAG: hypothetical protein ABEJ72_06950, partial [Candidatus Aenigmatarchaeota archaeon]
MAVEFSEDRGGYFFIERADPSPEWIKNAWNLLRENGWQGFSFDEIRGNCRGVVKVLEDEDYTAVIDKARKKVFHNRGLPEGVGDIDKLEEFWDETEKRPEGRVLETGEGKVRIKLSNGEELWMEDKIGVSEEYVGEKAELTLEVCLGRRDTDATGEVTEELGIRSQEDSKFGCKLVGEVTGYDVEDEWPRAGSSRGYPPVGTDAGTGNVVGAHENVKTVKQKPPHHKERFRCKVVAREICWIINTLFESRSGVIPVFFHSLRPEVVTSNLQV